MTMVICPWALEIVMKSTNYQIPAGNFKAKCLQLMDEVKQKHISITITKHGKAVAKLVPVEDIPIDFFGCLKGTVTINDDITKSIDVEWESNE